MKTLMFCDGGNAVWYATTGRYPRHTTALHPDHAKQTGAWSGEVRYSERLGKRVAIPDEKVDAILVVWPNGGDVITIHHIEQNRMRKVTYRCQDRERITQILGSPRKQARIWNGCWTYLRRVSKDDMRIIFND